jgi:hypothetical protein
MPPVLRPDRYLYSKLIISRKVEIEKMFQECGRFPAAVLAEMERSWNP